MCHVAMLARLPPMPMEGVAMLSESGQHGESVRKRSDTIYFHTVSDRRVCKTRAMLLASFDRLLLARGYDGVSIREVTADAEVARSTFYEHFGGKQDLLEHSVGRLLNVFAAATTTTKGTSDALQDMLTHVGAQSVLASVLLRSSARAVLIRVLTHQLERYLVPIAKRSAVPPIAPVPFLAAALAHAQLGAVDAWLSGDGCCNASTAALVLQATTSSAISAMFRSSR